MLMFPTSDAFDPLDPEEVKRRRSSNAAQAATNSSPSAALAQQLSQPAGGNFQPAPPESVSNPNPLKGLVGQIMDGSAPAMPKLQPKPMTPAGWQQPMGGMTTPAAAGDKGLGPAPAKGVTGTSTGVGESGTAPIAPPPTTPTATPAANTYGTQANLDPAYIESQIRATFARKGVQPTAEDISYWMGKATTPDIYSDKKVRVGWNPYWEDRLMTGSDSSDPRLAGDAGLIADPSAYGLNISTRGDGSLNADWIDALTNPTTANAPATVQPTTGIPAAGQSPDLQALLRQLMGGA